MEVLAGKIIYKCRFEGNIIIYIYININGKNVVWTMNIGRHAEFKHETWCFSCWFNHETQGFKRQKFSWNMDEDADLTIEHQQTESFSLFDGTGRTGKRLIVPFKMLPQSHEDIYWWYPQLLVGGDWNMNGNIFHIWISSSQWRTHSIIFQRGRYTIM